MDITVEQHDLKQDHHLIGLPALMRMTITGEDMGTLGLQLIARAGADPHTADANALMDLSTILQLRGDRELGLDIQRQALALQQIYSPPMGRGLPDRNTATLRLLAIMGEGDLMANSPVEFLLEDVDVALDIVYVTQALDLPQRLPEHDVLFVAIAESEQNLPLLGKIQTAIAAWPCPVLNRPEHIATLSRDNNGARLKSVPGLDMPTTAKIAREELERVACGELGIAAILDDGDFPVIVRPVDSHAGQGLEKLADAGEIAGYLNRMTNSEFYVSRFVDYRSADGLFRKYRIVLIEGRPFICHMGISEHWMIHYLNAGMADSADKRAEEAQFMADFDAGFAVRHAAAFNEINARLGLNYVGIDCAESADGRLLIFEVDSCMVVHAVDSIDIFPYKQPQMHKVFAAFRQMLIHAMQQA
ncbi:MAG: RimK family alpha-L-glutamate ligase [Proteobacteria bacterium]|nr:RimK family alpha-L-glutamate ligase [Pseudomonadota bacterium]